MRATMTVLFALCLSATLAVAQSQPNCKALCIDDLQDEARVFWNSGSSGLGLFTFSAARGGQLLIDETSGTLRVFGEIVSVNNSDRCFVADITFSGNVPSSQTPPAGSPKLPSDQSLLVSNGGTVDPSTWEYYTNGVGSLTGTGDFDGAIVQVDIRGAAMQIGFGANQKDALFGIATWLDFTTLQQPNTGVHLPAAWVGDINGTIARECVDFPFPGTDDDFRLCTGVNGPPTCGPGENVKSALTFDVINMKVESPNGTHSGEQVLFYVNCWATCLEEPPFFDIPGFEFIYLTPGGGNVELFGPTSPLGFPALDAQGCLVFDFPLIHPAFEGLSLLFQAFVVDSAANNGVLAATDAHRIDVGFPPSMPAPLNVNATNVDEHGATITWAAVDASPYRIEKYAVCVDGVKVGETSTTSFEIEDLPELTSVTVSVSAIDNLQYETAQSTGLALTTLADLTAPVIEGATATGETTVVVSFDEAIEPACAQDTNNFSIDNGIVVHSATLLADGKSVELVVDLMGAGVTYMLSVSNIIDTSVGGNMIAPNTQVEISGQRVTTDLVALYSMDEGAGTIVRDTSGFGAPLDLTIDDPSHTSWIAGGLSIDQGTIIKAANASKITTACQASNEITVECWVRPANDTQGGPARIATLSSNTSERNFTVAQEGDDFLTRLRTDSTSNNGLPNLVASNEVVVGSLSHVVFTRNPSGLWRMLIDGVEQANGQRGGDFSNWNGAFGFALANEFTDNRDWLGEIHLVAVYSRALDDVEVGRNFDAGP